MKNILFAGAALLIIIGVITGFFLLQPKPAQAPIVEATQEEQQQSYGATVVNPPGFDITQFQASWQKCHALLAAQIKAGTKSGKASLYTGFVVDRTTYACKLVK